MNESAREHSTAEVKDKLKRLGGLESSADPLAVFVAGAFVGFTVGPRIVRIAKDKLESRSTEIATLVIDRFMDALKGNLDARETDATKQELGTEGA